MMTYARSKGKIDRRSVNEKEGKSIQKSDSEGI